MMTVRGLLFISTYLNTALAGCIFGPSDLSQLALRNDTILSLMNDTLHNLTSSTELVIVQGSSFSLIGYLSKTHAVDGNNFLAFVNAGKLLTINWTQATQTAFVNGTFDGLKLNEYIKQHFVQPVQAALQNLSEMFSFSIGIFRPNQTQFHYTGLAADANGNRILDTTCYAGSAFLWRLSTDLPYDVAFDDHLSSKYANLASTIEHAMDSYYRTKSIFGGSFVRANVKDVTKRLGGGNFVVAYVEVYFLNETYNATGVTGSTILSQMSISYQAEGSSSSSIVTLADPPYTHINASYYAPPTTKTSTTTTMTTEYTSTLASTSSSHLTSSTSSTLTTEISSTQATHTVTEESTTATSTIQNIALNATPTLTPSSSTFWTSPSIGSTAISSPTLLITLVTTLLTQQSGTSTHSEIAVNNANWTSDTTQTVSSNNLTAFNTSSTLSLASNSVIGINATTAMNWNSTVRPSWDYTVTTFNIFNNNTTNVASGSKSTGTLAGTSTSNYKNDGGTTYDPDPFFKARVPVVTKVYNDDYLLRMKIGTMKPLTETKNFLVVTIPTIIGMLLLFTCCLLCWQMDCYPQTGKM